MNGLLIVNKEKGITSRDVVNKVGKILKTKKIGHTGTLDPIASGVLVLVLGKCTKLCDYITHEYKEYIAEFELGYETDSYDVTGNIIKTSNNKVSNEEIVNVISGFIGSYNQVVPIYSAVKIDGKKLYEYARNNISVNLPSRLVNIKNIDILSIDKTIKIKCTVSKGTYIRSLIKDIGDKLGTYATMINLVRTKLGDYDIKCSYTIEDINNNNYKLIGIDEYFSTYRSINMDEDLYKKIKNGVILDNIYNSLYVVFKFNNNIVCIYKEYEKSKIKPFIMI